MAPLETVELIKNAESKLPDPTSAQGPLVKEL